MTDTPKDEPDPRARWRKLPPEPTEFIEETDHEPSAIDYGSDYDPDAKVIWGGGAP